MSDINLKEYLNEISVSIEPVLKELLIRDVENINSDMVYYQCQSGGKRIRPALVVASGQLFGINRADLFYPAAAIEILHNATLIIDDVIDHSEFRRDEPTVWSKFGKSMAECTAFAYLASVFTGVSQVKNGSKLVDLYGKTLKTIIDGEIKDILFERSGREDEGYVVKNRYKSITKDDYYAMISQKTAVLLQACCQAGAICADATDDQVWLVGDFGFNLGMAFQIRDDVLDIFGDEKEFGKKIGKDIIEKKMGNFIILSAIEQLGQDDRKTICDLLEGSADISDNDVSTVTALVKKTDALQQAEAAADLFAQNSLRALEELPRNGYNDILKELVIYIVEREK